MWPQGCTKWYVKIEGGCKSECSDLNAGQWSHSRDNDIHWILKYEQKLARFGGREMVHILQAKYAYGLTYMPKSMAWENSVMVGAQCAYVVVKKYKT